MACGAGGREHRDGARRPLRKHRRGDAVLAQVLEVERPHQVADLALAGVGHVVEVRAQPQDVVIGLLVLAGAASATGSSLISRRRTARRGGAARG